MKKHKRRHSRPQWILGNVKIRYGHVSDTLRYRVNVKC